MPDIPPPPVRGRGYRLANALSYIINPLILPPIGFVLVLWHFGADTVELVTVGALSLVFFTILPLWYLWRMVEQGEAESLEVRQRAARWRPLLFGVGTYLLGVLAIVWVATTARPLFVALAIYQPVNILVVALITRRWKISVHMVAVGGFLAVLLFSAGAVSETFLPRPESMLRTATVLPLLLLVPVMMWARVKVKAHTVGQVIGGSVFGLAVPYLQLEITMRMLGLV